MTFFSILTEILQALVLGLSLSIGILLGIILLFRISRSKQIYDIDDLKAAFTDYFRRMQEEEQYEQLAEVKLIVSELQVGRLPKHLIHYKIKSDIAIRLDEEGGSKLFRMIKRYIVIGKRKNNHDEK